MITNAYQYTSNEDLLENLNIKLANEVIQLYALKYERRLHKHPNTGALQLLDVHYDLFRPKCRKPHELVQQIS